MNLETFPGFVHLALLSCCIDTFGSFDLFPYAIQASSRKCCFLPARLETSVSSKDRYWLKRGPIWNAGRQNLGKPTKFIGLVNTSRMPVETFFRKWCVPLLTNRRGGFFTCKLRNVKLLRFRSSFERVCCVTTKFHDGRTYRPRVCQRLIFLAIDFLIHIFLYSGKSPDSIVARINFIALNEFVLVTLNYCPRIWVDLGSTSVTSYAASSMWSWMNCFPIGTHVFPMLHVIKSCHPVFFFASAYCGCLYFY